MEHFRRTLTAFLFAATLSAVSPATADGTMTPPTVVTYVTAEYPAAASREADVAVDLELTIDVEGQVTDARVVTPVGDGFDEAALAALRQFVFTPALKDGAPVASRIRYRYVFTAPVADIEQAPAAIITGRFEGRVLSRAGEPLVGADVTITDGVGATRTAVTDETGAFAIDELAAGTYHVTVAALDHATLSRDEEIRASELAAVTYRLAPVISAGAGSYGAVATITAPSREITRRAIEASELTKIAGTRGDALRAIEILPGVGRPPSLSGSVILRGSAHGDSQVFLDGAPVAQLYHFGGLTSFVNGSLLRRVELYPGNFSVRYGRKLGGVIEAELRDPRADRFHAGLDLNLIDASALVEGPITEQLSFAIGGRRSHVDTWLGPMMESADSEVTAAPVYRDWQVIAAYKPTTRDRLRLVAYNSSDELSLIAARPGGEMSTQRDRFGEANSMTRLRADWKRTGEHVQQDIAVTVGTRNNRVEAGVDLQSDISGTELIGRAEWRAPLASWLELDWGLDVQHTRARIDYRGPRIEQTEGNPRYATGELETASLATTSSWFRPGAYVEAIVTPTTPLAITAGLRADHFGEIDASVVDPRLTARYRIGATTLKAGVGRFSQPPELGQALPMLGNPSVGPAHAIHYGIGVEQQLTERVSVGMETYYKQLDDLIVNGADGMLANAGIGRIYGLELAGRWQPGGAFSGFLSYSLSRSERNDDGSRWRLFDHDQTHILTAAAMYELGAGWELGGTFRLVSGDPETPVVGSIFDADHGTYRAIFGETNSARKPTFHRLDLRIEKQFSVGVAVYLDLQNAYNQRNSEGTAYSYDFSERRDTAGLPLIPSLGVKGEL